MKVAQLGSVTVMTPDQIKPYERNPRRIPERAVELVAASLTRFGWQQPVVVDKEHELVVGHVRLLAAKSLGLQHVPVVVADKLTEDEIRAYRIADNRSQDYSSWDFDKLDQELASLGDEWADVLALDDWESAFGAEEIGIDVPPEVRADVEGGYEVGLTFEDKDSADAAMEYLADLDGVLDVRYRRG